MKNAKLSVIGCFARLKDVKGINYAMKTNSRKHYVPDLNVYVGKCFHIGNLKISRNVAIFSLKEIFTCLDYKDCAKDCYAVKASLAYPTCNNFRWLMTYLAINHLDLLKSYIIEDLERIRKYRKNVRFVRIHESGDFFNQSYLNMWKDIAKLFTDFKFYFYTKSDKFLDFSEFVAMDNVNMVKSHLPNGDINFDDYEIIKEKCERYNVPLCPYGVNGNFEVSCGECDICMKSECVGFVKH